MKIVCIICRDVLGDDCFVAAPCGHTFHRTCLDQWLVHQKSCPHCRERCLPKQTLRLYLDSNSTDTDVNSELDNLSVQTLKERLQEEIQLNKDKNEALKKTKQELIEVREELVAWQSQYEATQFKVEKEKAINESLKHQVQLLQKEKDVFEEKAEEAKLVKKQLVKLEKFRLLLEGDKEGASEIINNSSLNSLKSYVTALKGEYTSIKERKILLQKEKDKCSQEISRLKQKVHSQDIIIQKHMEDLKVVQSDLSAAETEKENLVKKVQLLEKAIESPNSRTTLQRLLESPMPLAALSKRPKLDQNDFGSSPLLNNDKENKHVVKQNEPSVLMPVQKAMAFEKFSSTINNGFNGFGGHSKLIIPPSSNRPLKFAPRLTATSSNTKQPPKKLKF